MGSAISKVKRDSAMRSRVVVTDALRMLTCVSDRARVTSDSRRARSRASTWMLTRNRLLDVGAHSTSTMRSGSACSPGTLTQSERCTETPAPRVTNPTISSPGTGVQQRASLTHTSAAPLTMTPTSPGVRCRDRTTVVGVMTSAASSAAPSTPPADSMSRLTIVSAEMRPSPTDA